MPSWSAEERVSGSFGQNQVAPISTAPVPAGRLRARPPTRLRASWTMTVMPARYSASAALRPAMPAPTTTTPKCASFTRLFQRHAFDHRPHVVDHGEPHRLLGVQGAAGEVTSEDLGVPHQLRGGYLDCSAVDPDHRQAAIHAKTVDEFGDGLGRRRG